MLLPIQVRPACNQDIPQMCALLADLFTIEAGFSVDCEKQARALGRLIADSNGSSFVAVAAREELVLGMGSVQLIVSTAEGGLAGLVEDIVVRKDHRGSGIGSRILTELADWSRMRGATRLQLLADSDNLPALRFYRRNGWTSINLIALRKFI